jgi:hypothetical protein
MTNQDEKLNDYMPKIYALLFGIVLGMVILLFYLSTNYNLTEMHNYSCIGIGQYEDYMCKYTDNGTAKLILKDNESQLTYQCIVNGSVYYEVPYC